MSEAINNKIPNGDYLTGLETQALLTRLIEFSQHSQVMGGNDAENTVFGYIRKIQAGELLTRADAAKIGNFFGDATDKSTNYH